MSSIKKKLIKKLHDENRKVFWQVHEGVADGDLCGFDSAFYRLALDYVPNNVLKNWIKKCQKEIKESKCTQIAK